MTDCALTPLPLRLLRGIRLALLVLSGALSIVLLFPLIPDRWRLLLKQRWSAVMLDILAVRIDADLPDATPGCLLVANHISWLDIFAINAVLPAAFVAKEEVRRWPVIGWLAACNDTVFLRRGSRGHARLINAEIGDKLAQGKYVAVFPEGTTTDGTQVLHFHAALLQPALAAGRPVVPLAVSYWESDGSRSLAPRYDGEVTLGQCLRAILSRRRLRVRLQSSPALGLSGEDRRVVAAEARAAISRAAGLPVPESGTGRDLPAAVPSIDRPRDSRCPAPEDWAPA